MNFRVGFVLKLAAQEPAVLLGQFHGLSEHAAAFQRRRREDYPGPQKAHELAPLNAEVLRHHHHQRIALLGAHHGEPDPGVAAGRFDDRLSRRELSGALGIADDSQGQAILDRPHGIERLDLHV